MTEKVPVSVLIPALNEIANMKECIDSVRFSDDIVVVDSGSKDGSVEAAEMAGARVVPFDWNGEYPKKKNWALENVDWRYEWVLIVDADERITMTLAREIAAAIQQSSKDGFYINRRFMFLGSWIRHCGYYPSWNLRLFKHAKGRYEVITGQADTGSGDNEVHEHVILDGEAGHLRHDMLHYAYPSIAVWVEKHNRYSNWEAELMAAGAIDDGLRASPFGTPLERKRWIKRVAQRLPARPLLRFVYHYIYRQGFRDGYRGWLFCWLLAWYEFLSVAKAYETRIARREHSKR